MSHSNPDMYGDRELPDSLRNLPDAAELAKGPARIDAPAPEHIMQFFAYGHLPAHLQAISKPFGDLAADLVANIPRNPERTVALRKLLESKDAAVRAFLAK